MPHPSSKRIDQSAELENFKKALSGLEKADASVIAELSAMFKKISKLTGFNELKKDLSPDALKFAAEMFGAPEGSNHRQLPKLLFGHPPEITNKIFEGVDPIDLLNLATVSKSSKALVESLIIKLDHLNVGVDVNCGPARRSTAPSYPEYMLDFGFISGKGMEIRVEVDKSDFEGGKEKGETRKFGSQEFVLTAGRYHRHIDFYLTCVNKDSAEELSKSLCSFFYKIYKTPSISLHATDNGKGFMLYFINNITTKFHNFYYSSCFDHLTVTEHQRLMEGLDVTGTFSYKSSAPNFKYDKPFPYRRMKTDMEWNLSNIMNMKCESLKVKEVSTDEVDLKVILYYWKNGGLPQLENLALDIIDKNWAKMMGMPRWHPPLMDFKAHGTRPVNSPKCRYTRSNTGILAFWAHWRDGYQLLVWHDKFLTPDIAVEVVEEMDEEGYDESSDEDLDE